MVLGDLNNDTNINLLDLVLLASYLDLDDSGNHYFPEMYNSINESSAISNISGIDGIRGIDENDLDQKLEEKLQQGKLEDANNDGIQQPSEQASATHICQCITHGLYWDIHDLALNGISEGQNKT